MLITNRLQIVFLWLGGGRESCDWNFLSVYTEFDAFVCGRVIYIYSSSEENKQYEE